MSTTRDISIGTLATEIMRALRIHTRALTEFNSGAGDVHYEIHRFWEQREHELRKQYAALLTTHRTPCPRL